MSLLAPKRESPDLDRIRRAADLAMTEGAHGNDHLAYLYCAWIKRHVEELLYEDLYYAGG